MNLSRGRKTIVSEFFIQNHQNTSPVQQPELAGCCVK